MVIQPECFEDLQLWAAVDPHTLRRIFRLMEEILRTPFQGTGKPEPLRHWREHAWSRRINEADRLVCVVQEDRIDFIQARHHYDR